ncbi:MAG: hypothetical protein H0T65_01030, partial [Deltaproteobacteria bacterium]|nr:hypothetical protein [Deltaproteobacteria bacterium]
MKIVDIPFRERPVVELLALDRDCDPDYAGYGWAKVARVWLESPHWRRRVDDVLLLAIHAADDGAAREQDVELDFEVGDVVARADASAFAAQWLPHLPPAKHVVLVMCNPHRAQLAQPPGAHYGAGDVRAWLDPGDRIRLTADAWRIVPRVNSELEKRPDQAVSDEDKQTYAGLYVLKKMDMKPKEGGMTFPVVLPSELSPLDEVLQQLAVDEHVLLNSGKNRWDLTKKGIAYLGRVIDEATDLVDEFDDDEMEDVVAELKRRRLDPMRARFIWGWYDGEFDNLVHWQE